MSIQAARQMERTGQQDTSGGGDPGHMPDSSAVSPESSDSRRCKVTSAFAEDEVNSSRIARLGKKLLELDGQARSIGLGRLRFRVQDCARLLSEILMRM